MKRLLQFVFCSCTALAACLQARATNLVTGNGFGFTVVTPQNAAVTKFYAHPYSFAEPDPQNPLSEGIATANFIKSLSWAGDAALTAEYTADSHVIRAEGKSGEGFFFMPFGLRRAALIAIFEPKSADKTGFHVEWNAPLEARRDIRSMAPLPRSSGSRESRKPLC